MDSCITISSTIFGKQQGYYTNYGYRALEVGIVTAMRINGDHIDAACNLYREKSISSIGNATQLISFTLVTLIAVIIPLGVLLDDTKANVALEYIIIALPLVLLPPFYFLVFKYNEYKGLYKEFLVRNMANHSYCSANSTVCIDLDTFLERQKDRVINHVMYATGLGLIEASELVGRAKGNAFCMKIYCDE